MEKAKKVFQERVYQLGQQLLPYMSKLVTTTSLTVKGLSGLIEVLIKYGDVIMILTTGLVLASAKQKLLTAATVTWNTVCKIGTTLTLAHNMAMALLNSNTNKVVAATKALTVELAGHNVILNILKATIYLTSSAFMLLTGNITKAKTAFRAFTAILKTNPYVLIIAAITAVLYSQFLLTALYLGFSVGVAPILSYHYGAGNCAYLNKLKRICYKFVLATSVLSFVLAFSMSNPLASLFSENNQNVHELIKHGMMLFSVGFIFSGFNIFTSAFFTALSDGLTSAIVSFSRTFLFIIAGLYLMMAILGIDGLWLSIPFAELCAFVISIIFLKAKQKTMFEK